MQQVFSLFSVFYYKNDWDGTLGINFVFQEEAYTSKCDALAFESIEKHESYKGSRIKRGLFKFSVGKLINADINGALNIPENSWTLQKEPVNFLSCRK